MREEEDTASTITSYGSDRDVVRDSRGNDDQDDVDDEGREPEFSRITSASASLPSVTMDTTSSVTSNRRNNSSCSSNNGGNPTTSASLALPGALDFLGSFVYAPTDSSRSPVALPAYEYCSVAMLNQAKFGRAIHDQFTDKGGTIKNVLQSSKSFLHYLTTYPLKNTFRGYIQLAPYLQPRHIALPRHYALEIFSIDLARDRRFLHRRGDDEADRMRWPDERFEFYFDTTQNFTLLVKRDPCIHNGSVVAVSRVYIMADCAPHVEAIYVSSFVLRNLNADFDGDAVTVMMVRGIEATLEIDECMRNARLYATQTRFSFAQSFVYRIFRRLCFDNNEEMGEALSAIVLVDPDAVKRVLLDRTNIRSNERAAARARATFGPWYDVYASIYEESRRTEVEVDALGVNGRESWERAVWRVPVLDRITLVTGSDDFIAWMLHRERSRTAHHHDDVAFLREGILCPENWLIVHSGAKSSPRELWDLYVRDRSYRARRTRVNPWDDFFAPCTRERIDAYKRYMDDFVTVSKNVPRSSYFASGLKWVSQTCSIRDNDFIMGDRVLLRNVGHYLRDLGL